MVIKVRLGEGFKEKLLVVKIRRFL